MVYSGYNGRANSSYKMLTFKMTVLCEKLVALCFCSLSWFLNYLDGYLTFPNSVQLLYS